ncbi:MAG: hypothetical protein LBF41_04810 [Deltaproteobacteria bacterium]|jgi:putative effector of murein hydrolase LrgA (UPF0299 family)|nr:hypothetical protein [Deltaproteobacteria bacterium]
MFKLIMCGLMALLFTPAGIWIIYASFTIENAPHVFVMFIFSGSLMILLGLVGLGGLILREKKDGENEADCPR